MLVLMSIPLASFSELCTIHVDLNKAAKDSVALIAKSGETYYQVHYNVISLFGNTEFSAQIAWWTNVSQEYLEPRLLSFF